jgi:aquaporin TIP
MNIKALIGEFMGVFALCFVGIFAIANAGAGATNLTGVAFAHGLAIAVMIAVFGAISGAHFNPAVTLAMFMTKRIDAKGFVGYVVAQILGGAIAAVLAGAAIGMEAVKNGTPALGATATTTGALIVEIVCTFFLVLVIFGSAVDKRNSGQAPLYIGLTIVAGILAAGPVSGAALNPARYIGPALVGGAIGPNAWIWFVGPLVGGAIAGLLYDGVIMKNEPDAV